MEAAIEGDAFVCFVHPSLERDIRRLNAQVAGSPLVKHAKCRGIRGRKRALMKAWHPVPLGSGA